MKMHPRAKAPTRQVLAFRRQLESRGDVPVMEIARRTGLRNILSEKQIYRLASGESLKTRPDRRRRK